MKKVALKKKARLQDLSELPGLVGKIRLDFFTEKLNKVDLISERKVEKAKINRTYLQNYKPFHRRYRSSMGIGGCGSSVF